MTEENSSSDKSRSYLKMVTSRSVEMVVSLFPCDDFDLVGNNFNERGFTGKCNSLMNSGLLLGCRTAKNSPG